jgi:hypothetical protein
MGSVTTSFDTGPPAFPCTEPKTYQNRIKTRHSLGFCGVELADLDGINRVALDDAADDCAMVAPAPVAAYEAINIIRKGQSRWLPKGDVVR